jgi:hypothetical protein
MSLRTAQALVLLLSPVLLNASQSLSAGRGSGTQPTGAPYSSLNNFRIQFRLHGGWSYTGGLQGPFGTTAWSVNILGANGIQLTSWYDGGVSVGIPVTAGTDVICRFQRFSTNKLIGESWNAQTGAYLGSVTISVPTPGTPNDSGSVVVVGSVNGALAYLRAYSTTVPVGTPPSNTFDGNLYDYEFEGNGTDQAGRANLNITSAAFAATPVYAPNACFNQWPALNTFRAGEALSLDASCSFTSTDNATLSYFWQGLSGPMIGTFSSRSASSSSFTAGLAGPYRVQLTVTDSNSLSSSTVASVGAVATDPNYVVITGLPSAMDNLIGPVVMMGKSPWKYWDLASLSTANSVANAFANSQQQLVLGAALSGTVTTGFAGSVELIGTGTHFTTETGVGQQLITAWDSSDGPGSGRYLDTVTSIIDDTHLTLQNNGVNFPAPAAAKVYHVPPDNSPTFSLSSYTSTAGGTFWNFYDSALTQYRLWVRTGDPAHLTSARMFADLNWTWMIDHGFAYGFPRGSSIQGQFLRALDGHPDRFPGLYAWMQFQQLNQNWNRPQFCINGGGCDTREAGYVQWGLSNGAKSDPDPTRHAWYCGQQNTLTSQWNGVQTPQGYFQENVYAGNQGYPYAPFQTTPFIQYGASPWRGQILVKALQSNYESLNDTTAQGCNNTSLASSTLTAIRNAIDFAWNYGRDSNTASAGYRGPFYDDEYPSNAQSATFMPGGSVTATLSSTSVTGSGTRFKTGGLLKCDGVSDYIGFGNAATNTGQGVVYKVTACASDTALTISPAFGSQLETANDVADFRWSYAPAYNVGYNCPGLSKFCPPNGDRDLAKFNAGTTAWLYHQTGNSVYKTEADEWMASIAGGPDSGPTASTAIDQFGGPGSGPNSDGYVVDMIAASLDCGAPNPPPCVQSGNAYANMGKNINEAMGAPGADNELGWRLGGLSPLVNRTLYFDFNLASVPGATQVRVTLTEPSGAVVTQTCSGSPCAAVADARQGVVVGQLTYLSAAGSPLTMGDPTILAVQGR